MGWRRTVIELHCIYSQRTNEFGTPPPYCKYGPGNPDVHCLTGETGDTLAALSNSPIDEVSDEAVIPCPYASYGRARTAIVLTDSMGEHDESAEFWTEENLSREQWNRASEEWRGEWRRIIQRSVNSDVEK